MATFNEVDASPSTGTASAGDVRLPRASVVSAAPQTGATNTATGFRGIVTHASPRTGPITSEAP